MALLATPAPSPGDIWPPDWSQFIPDTLSGFIVTGVVGGIVAVVLWRVQQRVAADAEARLAVGAWRHARSGLTDNLPVTPAREGKLATGRVVYKTLATEGPISEVAGWIEAVEASKKVAARHASLRSEMVAYSTIVEQTPEYALSGRHLNKLVRDGLDAIPGGDGGVRAAQLYFAHAIHGNPVEGGAAIFSRTANVSVAEAVDRLLADREVARWVKRYQVALDRIEAAYGTLRRALVIGADEEDGD